MITFKEYINENSRAKKAIKSFLGRLKNIRTIGIMSPENPMGIQLSKEENQDREEIGIAKLICEELLKLSIQERALLFSSYYSYRCDGNCKNCPIEKGNYNFDEW